MRMLPTLLFITLAMTIVGGAHHYAWARLFRDTGLAQPWPTVGRWLLVALWLSMPLSFILYRFLPGGREAMRLVLWPVYIWMGVLFILVMVLAIGDLARITIAGLLGADGGGVANPERRLLFGRVFGGLAAMAAAVLSTRALYTVLAGPTVRRLDVRLGRLPPALDGFTIVHLTDVHFGPTLRREFAEEIVRRTNELKPDLVAITGDLVDGTVEELREIVAPLAELRARHGVYFVTGNHEYYVGRNSTAGVESWIRELARLGVRTLRNQRVSIGEGENSFDLAGVDDWTARAIGHGPDLEAALAGRDARRELVLLAHQPRQVLEAAEKGVGLQLSGHTHGGQLWPWGYMVRLQQPYVIGLVQHGPTQLYVSPGTGYWGPPMRLGTTSEIAHITLRATRAA